MGAPKQKWTAEEEEALRAGVDKHGAGKWRTIQKDPEFSRCLATRSNIDLKVALRFLFSSSNVFGHLGFYVAVCFLLLISFHVFGSNHV